MNISCYLISNGEFVTASLPKDLLVELAVSLRQNGEEQVHFPDRSILVEGIYIPAKGTKNSLIVLPDIEDTEE